MKPKYGYCPHCSSARIRYRFKRWDCRECNLTFAAPLEKRVSVIAPESLDAQIKKPSSGVRVLMQNKAPPRKKVEGSGVIAGPVYCRNFVWRITGRTNRGAQ